MDNFEKAMIFGPIILIILLCWGMCEASKHGTAERNRLIKQCMDDGKKEYECVAMLNVESKTSVVPVVTPVYISR